MGAFCLIRYYHLMSDNQEVSLIWIIFYNKAVSVFFDNHIVIKQVLLDFFDRYSEERVFQNELLRTLKRVFEHDFRDYL